MNAIPPNAGRRQLQALVRQLQVHSQVVGRDRRERMMSLPLHNGPVRMNDAPIAPDPMIH